MTRIRNKLLVVLTALFLSFFVLFSISLKSNAVIASNDEQKVSVSTILMDEGASVRLNVEGDNADKNGIRFVMYVNSVWYDSFSSKPEIGIYVSRVSDLAQESTYTAKNEIPSNAMQFVATQFTGDSEKTEQDTISFNAVIYGIPESDFNTSLIANGYYKLAGEETYNFAANPQTRSIAQVASVALSEGGYEGDDLSALLNYVDTAVTEDNFKFASTQVKADMYQSKVSLGVTIPENLTAVWSSSDTSIATVDENGNVTRTGKFGSTTISATIGSKTIETVLTVNNLPVITYSDFGPTTEVDKDSWTADGLTGDYNGSALKSGGINGGFRLANPWSAEDLETLKETYDNVTLNIAFKFNGGYAYFYDNYGFYGYCAEANLSVNEGDGNVSKWFAWTMSIEDYITLVSASNYADFQVFFVYAEAYADFSIYFGELTLSANPIETTKKPVFSYNDFSYVEVDKAGWVLDGITGDYEGTALKSAGYNSNYRLVNPWTEEELVKAKETYDTVTLYMAFNLTGGYLMLYAGDIYGYFGFYLSEHTAISAANGNVGKWLALSMSMEDYIQLVAASNYADFQVFHAWSDDCAGLSIYFGELVLSDSTAIETTKSPVISYTDFGATTELDKAGWTADGLTGDYEGIALKSAGFNDNFRLANPWTEEELEELKETYSTVTLYMAFGLEDGYLMLYAGKDYGYFGYCLSDHTAISAANGNVGKWLALSMSIEDYISLVSASNYSNFQLFHAWSDNCVGLSIYFGELIIS